MWISKREFEALTEQVEFWRARADREQRRGDALVDQALMEAGRAPASPEVLDEQRVTAESMKLKAEALMKEFRLANVDDDGSEIEMNEDGGVPVSAEALEALRGKA